MPDEKLQFDAEMDVGDFDQGAAGVEHDVKSMMDRIKGFGIVGVAAYQAVFGQVEKYTASTIHSARASQLSAVQYERAEVMAKRFGMTTQAVAAAIATYRDRIHRGLGDTNLFKVAIRDLAINMRDLQKLTQEEQAEFLAVGLGKMTVVNEAQRKRRDEIAKIVFGKAAGGLAPLRDITPEEEERWLAEREAIKKKKAPTVSTTSGLAQWFDYYNKVAGKIQEYVAPGLAPPMIPQTWFRTVGEQTGRLGGVSGVGTQQRRMTLADPEVLMMELTKVLGYNVEETKILAKEIREWFPPGYRED